MKLRDIIAFGLLVVLAIGGRVLSSGNDGTERGGRRPDPRQFASYQSRTNLFGVSSGLSEARVV